MDNHIKFIPLSLFCVFALKCLVLSVGAIDAPVLLILGVISAFYEYQFQNRKTELLHKRFDEVDKHLTALYKAQQDVKSDMSTFKLAGQIRKAVP
jgi:hypothetical protein